MSTITPPRPSGTETWPPRAIQYLDQVAAALVGLDTEEREDLLDELQAHIDALLEVEVLAHGDATKISLVRQLGTPEAFAAELLETAGLAPPGEPQPIPSFGDRLRSRIHALRIPAVRSWLRQLAPVWWFARGYGAAVGLAWLGGAGLSRRIPIPWVLGNPFTGLIATAGLVYLSVEVGSRRRTLDRRWQRRALLTGGGLALIAVIGTLVFGFSSADSANQPIDQDAVSQPARGAMTLPNGEPVTNIYAFDRDGNPLSEVLLYDGAGNPLVLQETPNGQAYPFDSFGFETDFQRDADGQVVPNLYPLTQYSTGAADPQLPAGVQRDPGTGELIPLQEGDVIDPLVPVPMEAIPVGVTREVPEIDVPPFDQPVRDEVDESPADESAADESGVQDPAE